MLSELVNYLHASHISSLPHHDHVVYVLFILHYVTASPITGMPTLNLNCWIFNEDYKSVFPIKIACTKTVGALRNAIKEDQCITFQHVDPCNLDLWKVSIAIDTS